MPEPACRVLVVGKVADGLPFPVLDDGTSSRAPVHGLLAGLRQARYDVVVALPVDVPLVASVVLRALGEAGAVPSERIPLPGGYPRSLLPLLERRVAAGQLSLRGVNPNVLFVPEELLVDPTRQGKDRGPTLAGDNAALAEIAVFGRVSAALLVRGLDLHLRGFGRERRQSPVRRIGN